MIKEHFSRKIKRKLYKISKKNKDSDISFFIHMGFFTKSYQTRNLYHNVLKNMQYMANAHERTIVRG